MRGPALAEEVVVPRAPYGEAELLGRVASPRLDEISGMAPSQRREGVWWMINDGARRGRLHAVGRVGEDLGFVEVADVTPVDWESLAHFAWQGRPYLVVADVGDNWSWREEVELLVIEEPAFRGERVPVGTSVAPAWRIRFRYPDGPRDCEAVAVDRARERVLLVSKRTDPPLLYELPLLPDALAGSEGVLTAAQLGSVLGIPPPHAGDVARRRFVGRYFAMPDGLDLADDGRRAVVVTYRDAYLYERAADESWAAAFARTPLRLGLPPLHQAEAVAFEPGTEAVVVTSEGPHPPLYRTAPLENQNAQQPAP